MKVWWICFISLALHIQSDISAHVYLETWGLGSRHSAADGHNPPFRIEFVAAASSLDFLKEDCERCPHVWVRTDRRRRRRVKYFTNTVVACISIYGFISFGELSMTWFQGGSRCTAQLLTPLSLWRQHNHSSVSLDWEGIFFGFFNVLFTRHRTKQQIRQW